MTRRFFAAIALAAGLSLPARPAAPAKPKLVVAIIIDQFRYDYLTRFRADYQGGLARLLQQGAVFTNAHLIHYPTYTAVGHSTFLTGATPGLSGIIGNDWYDREQRKTVTSVSDETVQLLGGGPNRTGQSPRRLLVSTLGDELKLSRPGQSRVIGVSLKDRAAILPAGHAADGAFWFDDQTGNFVSSTFYFQQMPEWAQKFNSSRPADLYLGKDWKPLDGSSAFARTLASQPGHEFYAAIESTPYGNELVERFAELAVEAEQLGRRDDPDVLTVSFSSNDYVGHATGPLSPEVRDMAIRTDRLLGHFFEFLNARVGLDRVLIVLSADHGVAPAPPSTAPERMPGGYFSGKEYAQGVEEALARKFGKGPWIENVSGQGLYLSQSRIGQRKLKEEDVQNAAAEAAAAQPHVWRVYTRTQILRGQYAQDPVAQMVVNSYVPRRSADVLVLMEPYWIPGSKSGTTHGSVFGYDTHVPVIFLGAGIRAGQYDGRIAPNDIAPTLATLLAIETPSGAFGRVLTEMLQ